MVSDISTNSHTMFNFDQIFGYYETLYHFMFKVPPTYNVSTL